MAQVVERFGGRVAGVGFQKPDEIRLGIRHTASLGYLTTE
jgi:hypothetical protein